MSCGNSEGISYQPCSTLTKCWCSELYSYIIIYNSPLDRQDRRQLATRTAGAIMTSDPLSQRHVRTYAHSLGSVISRNNCETKRHEPRWWSARSHTHTHYKSRIIVLAILMDMRQSGYRVHCSDRPFLCAGTVISLRIRAGHLRYFLIFSKYKMILLHF